MKFLIRQGSDPTNTCKGWTALHAAAVQGNADIVSVLLEAGADVNADELDGGTPLHVAVAYDHLDASRVLLACGADTSAVNNDGDTPLDIARRRSLVRLIALLRWHDGPTDQ